MVLFRLCRRLKEVSVQFVLVESVECTVALRAEMEQIPKALRRSLVVHEPQDARTQFH